MAKQRTGLGFARRFLPKDSATAKPAQLPTTHEEMT